MTNQQHLKRPIQGFDYTHRVLIQMTHSSVTENSTARLQTSSLLLRSGMRSPPKTSSTSSDWQHLLRKVFSELTSWTGCIFVPRRFHMKVPPDIKEVECCHSPLLHLLLTLEFRNFKWKGCAGWVHRAKERVFPLTPLLFLDASVMRSSVGVRGCRVRDSTASV